MKLFSLFSKKSTVNWDYRLMEFVDINAADEDARYIKLVEVYYDKEGYPHSWCEPQEIVVDNFITENLVEEYRNTWASFTKQAELALDKPVLLEIDFE